ncbi:DUF4307 domain-containing protein [Mycolicibacterium gadium]|jgi:hypothetical protein|uniref:DUF4307 domain-containing protein n=1 Tax=Mycolicibacterium gadium TaxID=1794 RepID=A0A7I7WNH9_MYCGU|nr:DUF4307 domain-containing protein [Mycolicibacterium gadium]MDG5486163.1 DUF4307 domain-containing protein [Mycolicibacterium gadium]BBZ18650.1 membrane protein [Mycolicibacterium gadium]
MIERPSARYGRQRLTRRQRRLIAGGLTALVLVVGVTIAVIASGRFSNAVKGELGGYRLVDDETVDVTISVTREDPSQPVVCIIRARAIDGSETGRREVLVPPAAQQTVQVTAVVKSNKPPVVGDVYGCGADVPSYLVAP